MAMVFDYPWDSPLLSASMANFGEALKRERDAKDYTQLQLAQLTDVSLTTIARLEQDTRRAPSKKVLKKLARKLPALESFLKSSAA
jgi:transcriptional regulator with XRE-family HTH domain